jgi:hypothetical protein
MKTITFKLLLATLILFLIELQGFAQHVGMMITVRGLNTTYSDQAWIFAIPTCSYYFDNGWDGRKMPGGTSDAPQIYIPELDGNYQVAAIPDLNNTHLNFIAGKDTTYTLTFASQNLSNLYQSLYLIDSLANKTIDINNSGVTYEFKATNKSALNRFKIVTSLPIPTVINEDTIPSTPPIVVSVTDSVISNSIVVPSTIPTSTEINIKKRKNDNSQKLKIYNYGETIYVENQGEKGKINLYNAYNGRVINSFDFNAEGITLIQSGVPKGSYIINGLTPTEKINKLILVE